MRLSAEEIEAIADALLVRFKAEQVAHWVEPETHAEQHRFISEWMAVRQERREMWRKVRGTVIGYLIIVAIGGIGLAAYQLGVNFIRSIKGG